MEVVGVGGALRLGSGWRVHSVSKQESPRLFGARHHNIFVCVCFFKCLMYIIILACLHVYIKVQEFTHMFHFHQQQV